MVRRAWMKREQWFIWIVLAILLTLVLAAIGYLAGSANLAAEKQARETQQTGEVNMATVAQRLYPRMTSSSGGSSSQAASSPAPRKEFAQIAAALYPQMRRDAPTPSRTERAGFYKRVLTCDMTGPMKGRLRYVDVPLSRTLGFARA